MWVADIYKKYMRYPDTVPEAFSFPNNINVKELDEPVRVILNKGLNHAPDIVKLCYLSVEVYKWTSYFAYR